VEQPLRIASFNAQDFYLLLDRDYSRTELEGVDEADYLAMNSSIYNSNKPRNKIAEIAETILDMDFDLVGLCEVGGMETLSAFNRIYLNNKYNCYIYEQNSRRGIFVGALLKNGRFPGARARDIPVDFSRNLLRLDLGPKGGGLEVFVVHLKSQRGGPDGLEQRVHEVEELASFARKRACVIMGDFNGIAVRGESEFEYDPLLALPFRDVLEALDVPPEKRRTHYYFDPRPRFAQLDYIFCSNDITVQNGGVIEKEIPLNMDQRSKLPSDHLFIWADIEPAPLPPAAAILETAAIEAADIAGTRRPAHAPSAARAHSAAGRSHSKWALSFFRRVLGFFHIS